MALVGSGFMPNTMLHLPISNSYHHKVVTIRCAARKGRGMSKGGGPKIHSVLRISKRIEVGVREENTAPFAFNALEDNKDSKKDDASALESAEATDNYFGKANVL